MRKGRKSAVLNGIQFMEIGTAFIQYDASSIRRAFFQLSRNIDCTFAQPTESKVTFYRRDGGRFEKTLTWL